MIRVAAVGDVHYGLKTRNPLAAEVEFLKNNADVLLLAGDLTQSGDPDEARRMVYDLSAISIPIVAVLGNHDYHRGLQEEIHKVLLEGNRIVLEGAAVRLKFRGKSVGIAGIKGFGGGFFNGSLAEFGEKEIKAFARESHAQAKALERVLGPLDTDYRFVLLHYSPVEATLQGERRDIYPFLGSYLLAEVIDSVRGIRCVFHGHAHRGLEKGITPGGVPVRNVAQPVIRQPCRIYTFD